LLKYNIKINLLDRKMSNFNIDDEVDKLIDKLVDQFKSRLKKLIVRSEKQVLRQYIASQKETARVAKTKNIESSDSGNRGGKKIARRVPKREVDYGSSSSDASGSDYD
jgi:hypothetical protein